MAPNNPVTQRGEGVLALDWETWFLKTFDDICQQFWRRVEVRSRQPTIPAPKTQQTGRALARHPTPKRRIKWPRTSACRKRKRRIHRRPRPWDLHPTADPSKNSIGPQHDPGWRG
ncbi:Hypothetical predicted protein [Pelobates cultripes]|uniref:Uncharacterized protein n=1 Tax=Pelobates cultripes TaxID=61616 RepID=A0AAD1R1A0_PELCU|nr:Hypothetical predicted protein [Pelobates cultripes]